MIRSIRFMVVVAAAGFSLAACDVGYPIIVRDPQLVAQPDKVSMMLAQAADKASNALETLAAVEQKRTPSAQVGAITGAPSELMRAMSINWIGPVDQITKSVSNKAGYQFVTLGTVPATPIVVAIDVTNKPIIDILRSIGLQLGPRANVHVDSAQRVVELNYAPVTGVGDVALTPMAQ
jgi:defect-in-organelle-trafficking protein DotD